MKTLRLALLTITSVIISNLLIAQMPGAITIEPPDATAYDELTLYLDPELACFESGSLMGLDSIAIHSGVQLISGEVWQHVIGYDGTGINGQAPILYPTGDGRFSITYTPADFYGLEAENVTHICAVFNNGNDWYNDGRDYMSDSSFCADFFIPLVAPQQPTINFSICMTKAIDNGIFDPFTDEIFMEIEGYDPVQMEEGLWEDWWASLSEGLIPGNELSFTFSINQIQYEELAREVTVQDGEFVYHSWWNDDPYINYSGAISITPEIPLPSEEITITLNTLGSCPSNALLDADSIMMHSGLTIADNYWQYVIPYDSFGSNGQQPKLTDNGDGTWSITLIPDEFFGIPQGVVPEAINFVFNAGEWVSGEGKDFAPDGYCVVFYIPFNVPVYNAHTVDFENNGIGGDWNWIMQGNADNPPLEILDNPVSGGINITEKVAKFTAREDGEAYAYTHTIDDGQFIFAQNSHIVELMVYKPVISPISIKFDGPDGFAEILAWNTQVNQWEELAFDFSEFIGNTYNRFRILPDYEDRDEEHIIYLDNIQMPDGEFIILPEPTTAPPDPQHVESNVIPIYTEVYSNLAGTDLYPNWGQATQVTIDYTVAENNTLKYDYLDYQGTQFPSLDVSLFEKLHIDFWTPNSTEIKFHLISQGPVSTYADLPITTGEWVSVDLDLQDFAPPVDLTDVFQFMVEGNGTIYFDNWYFWRLPTRIANPEMTLNRLRIYPNPASDFITIQDEVDLVQLEIRNITGQTIKQFNKIPCKIPVSDLPKGAYTVIAKDINGQRIADKLLVK